MHQNGLRINLHFRRDLNKLVTHEDHWKWNRNEKIISGQNKSLWIDTNALHWKWMLAFGREASMAPAHQQLITMTRRSVNFHLLLPAENAQKGVLQKHDLAWWKTQKNKRKDGRGVLCYWPFYPALDNSRSTKHRVSINWSSACRRFILRA